MKKQIAIDIRLVSISILAFLIFTASAFAAPVVRKSGQASAANLDASVFQFLADFGGQAHGNGGSYQTGYRVIRWDDVAGAALNSFPADYFNTTVPRGMTISSACSSDSFLISGTQPPFFGNINPFYATDFKAYLDNRLFSATTGTCNAVDVYFYVPGTKMPATVSGFGVIFADVDSNFSAGITYFGIDGKQIIPTQIAPVFNNGLSLVGVTFSGGERVARVRINSGTATLGELDKSRGGQLDVVAMSNFFFAEPRAIGQHPSDFDGDGTSDYAVFRPSDANWYVMNSGTNTLSVIHWGANGDVPADGDFDGDSRSDCTVFRPSTGVWYSLRSSDGQAQIQQLGLSGDKPVAGDYDRDGITDIAVWRPSDGNYYSLNSSNGQARIFHFGANGDIPIGAATNIP